MMKLIHIHMHIYDIYIPAESDIEESIHAVVSGEKSMRKSKCGTNILGGVVSKTNFGEDRKARRTHKLINV
jgi:hypothetical protein